MRMSFRALYLREQQEKSARQMSGSTQPKGKGRCVPLIGGGGLASGSKRTHPVATCNMIFFSDMREVLVEFGQLDFRSASGRHECVSDQERQFLPNTWASCQQPSDRDVSISLRNCEHGCACLPFSHKPAHHEEGAHLS